MTTQVGCSIREGQLIDTPPLFNGINYTHWKARMRIFIQAHDYDLWSIIVNGLHTNTNHDKERAQQNAKAMNILYCALDDSELNSISFCITAKEIWNMLEVKYECTNVSSEFETSSEEEEYQTETENLCFVAHEDEVCTRTQSDFSFKNQVHTEAQSDFTFDELHDAFSDLYLEYKKLNLKNKKLSLKNKKLNLKMSEERNSTVEMKDKLNFENEHLRLNSEELIQKNQNLIKENQNLSEEVNQLKSFINKFTVSSERLKTMFESQHADFDKSKLDWTSLLNNKPLNKKVINSPSKPSNKITCFKYEKNRHKNFTYCFNTSKSNDKIITIKQIWIPKGTICTNSQRPKQAWVPKMKI